MQAYPLFYRKVISKFPDKWVEKTGGIYFRLAALFMLKRPRKLPVTIGKHEFSYPTGMPAGWIDHPNKISTVRKLGAGIIVIKTVTKEPKSGNPYPRIIRKEGSLINSMGLPNLGADWWQEHYRPSGEVPSIISIKGDNFSEWTELIEKLESKADIFELNVSCPNVSEGIMDMNESEKIVKDIAGITNRDLLLKLSPEYSEVQNLKLVTKIRDEILGISAINTLPVKDERLGNPTKVGGLSGKQLFGHLLAHLKSFRVHYPTFEDLPILASGGITTPQIAWEVFSDYKALPLSLTGFLTTGPKHYVRITDHLNDQLERLDSSVDAILYNRRD